MRYLKYLSGLLRPSQLPLITKVLFTIILFNARENKYNPTSVFKYYASNDFSVSLSTVCRRTIIKKRFVRRPGFVSGIPQSFLK